MVEPFLAKFFIEQIFNQALQGSPFFLSFETLFFFFFTFFSHKFFSHINENVSFQQVTFYI